jgi:CBS-domain-containing membrane protein
MNVGNVMTANVMTVAPEASVHKAATLMSDHGVSGLPVVDADGRLAGIVTEGDLILRHAAPRPKHWWHRFFAATPPATASASDDELVKAMRERIAAEPWTSLGLVVEASNGVITLWGVVASEAERSALETMARAVPGCRAVHNRLVAGVGLAYHYGE